MKSLQLLLLGIIIAFIFYLPAFKTFYTNDDFFHLKISRAASVSAFINFFNPVQGPEKLGLYRPLTTQTYYWISVTLFNQSPVPLRIISFTFLILVSLLVYYFIRLITDDPKAAGFAAILYLISSVHFGHIYYSGTFQELGLAFFFLLSCIFFLKKSHLLSLISFIFALLSKETAVTLPLVITGLYIFNNQKGFSLSRLLKILFPYLFILAVYAFFRFKFYGFAAGDSYVWVFSPAVINTAGWYLLWCLNLPEMLVDFIGPGLHINLNLFRFWGSQISLIFWLFFILVCTLIFIMFRLPKSFYKTVLSKIIFAGFWFLATLGPLLFLPWHKFAYNLTLPLLGVVMILGILLADTSRFKSALFLAVFLLLSANTLKLTVGTNWITQGEKTARTVNNYVSAHLNNWPAGTTLVFYDTPADSVLPWSPAGVLKTVLSDNNYFSDFTGGRIRALYSSVPPVKISQNLVALSARQFLGY
jgi:hypothetical protein